MALPPVADSSEHKVAWNELLLPPFGIRLHLTDLPTIVASFDPFDPPDSFVGPIQSWIRPSHCSIHPTDFTVRRIVPVIECL
jgi:hypothetical protein